MKVFISKVEVSKAEPVDILDECPSCGAVFAEDGFEEEQLIGASQGVTPCGSGEPDWEYEETEECADICHVTGYRCRCGRQLATTEE